MVTWKRYGGYEVSSHGDKRFSAFNTIMPDGRSIEMHYQCDVKGYDIGGKNWRLGKGKPPCTPMTKDKLYTAYLALWRIWANSHLELMHELYRACKPMGFVLSDKFATTPVNQAHALADILNELCIEY